MIFDAVAKISRIVYGIIMTNIDNVFDDGSPVKEVN